MTRSEAVEWAKYLIAVSEKLDKYAEFELGWQHNERRGFGQCQEAAQRLLLETGYVAPR